MTSPNTAQPEQTTGEGEYDPVDAAIVAGQTSTFIEPVDDFVDDGIDTNSISTAATSSLASSVRDYNFENGRRYHKFREGRYDYPNDEEEQEREDMKHAMTTIVCGGLLHIAPIGKNPQNIIDLGTGTGIWAIDMGDEYPSAQILGVDLSPIQPTFVPPNVRFMVDDFESPWLEKENFYDYVHARHLSMAIKDFPAFLRRAYAHTKPGGWFEMQEFEIMPYCDDGTMPDDWAMRKYCQLGQAGQLALGFKMSATRKEMENLANYGFINVKHEIWKVPIGVWPKNQTLRKIGVYLREAIRIGLGGMAYGPLCRGLGWSKEEVEVFLVEVRKSLEGTRVHAYYDFHIVYGQKPVEVEEKEVEREKSDSPPAAAAA